MCSFNKGWIGGYEEVIEEKWLRLKWEIRKKEKSLGKSLKGECMASEA